MSHARERGFALLAALWLVTALSVLAGVGIAVTRTGSAVTRNRVLLARAAWAREACMEILLARFGADPALRELRQVDLGRRTWCRATLDDPAAKLNVNVASRDALASVLPSDSLAAAIVAARLGTPFVDLRQLTTLPGFDASLVHRLDSVLTARGTGVVNTAVAHAAVLRTLPGMSEEAVRRAVYGRRNGRPVRSLDELASLLSPGARHVLLANYAELARLAVFAPLQLVATIEGGVGGTPIVARAVVTVVPASGRLAVIRREVE